MGGHYGTIHVRTNDHDAVRSAVEALDCEGTKQFLVAPSIGGWVTVFPENNGQDSSVSEALAAKLSDKTLIHCLVHDDDVFAYWVFEGGRIIDTYNSCPNYFGDSNPPPRGGNAAALRHLLTKPDRASELQALLDADRFEFELDRQDKFATMLGLPNTSYAYEYLQGGETDGVRHWKKFVHVPDLTAEKSAEQAAVAKERAEFKRLQRDKVLLVNEVAKRSGNKHFYKNPYWTIEPATSSVIFTWKDYKSASMTEPEWLRFSGPGWRPEAWQGLPLEKADSLTFSPTGSFVAILTRDGSIGIWNLRENQMAARKQLAGNIVEIKFTPDDNWLIVILKKHPLPVQLHRIALRPGLSSAVVEKKLPHLQTITIHPDGHMAAAVDNFGILVVVDLVSMRIVNQTWIREQSPLLPESIRGAIVTNAMEKIMGELKTHLATKELEQYRQDSNRHFLPKEAIRICTFSPDGNWLFCGTNGGLRGLRWDEVFTCTDMQPAQVHYSIDAETVSYKVRGGFSSQHKLVYGVVFDTHQQRALFSGLEGKISYFDLATQRRGSLLECPGRIPLVQLELTPDRAALVATAHRFDFEKNKQKPSSLQVWNYPALCRAAGLEY